MKFRLEAKIEVSFPWVLDALYCPGASEETKSFDKVRCFESNSRKEALKHAKEVTLKLRREYRHWGGMNITKLKIDVLLIPTSPAGKTWQQSKVIRPCSWKTAVERLYGS